MLALLVAVSLILLTAYFGAPADSPLHSVQRGIVGVLEPVQKGASEVLSPFRDVANWVSDTLHAKSENEQLRAQVQSLTQQVDTLQLAQVQNRQLTREVGLDQTIGIRAYDPVGANVIARDPTLWYQQVTVDAGSGDGVAVGDPVVGDGALVGDVTTVGSSFAIVTLLTDHTFAVAAEVLDGNGNGDTGLLVPAVGSPNQMLLQDLPATAPIEPGDHIVTAGFKSGSLQSLYPPGIPIGTVGSFDADELANSEQVPVTPESDLRRFDSVQILTRPYGSSTQQANASGDVRAQVP